MTVTTTGFDPQARARQAEGLADRIDRLARDCRYAASREQMVAISPLPLQDVAMAAELVRRFAELLRSDVPDE